MTEPTPDNALNGCRAICSVYGFHVFDCPNHEGGYEWFAEIDWSGASGTVSAM